MLRKLPQSNFITVEESESNQLNGSVTSFTCEVTASAASQQTGGMLGVWATQKTAVKESHQKKCPSVIALECVGPSPISQ